MKIRVYYEDTDAGGVVYHSNYLKFCERARSEIFFQKNADIFDKDRGHFLLKRTTCDFIKSAKLGDILEIKTQILELKNASVILEQDIFKDDIKIFSANFVLAYIKDSKPCKMDENIKKYFKELST
ncbi:MULTISPECIES: YbgC/FadM family acyl-CoA thioesterase [unclassified Campylobacter]|uniref:YbgC/FadM family acyl-CoA thioesterase n=1 Tax=unclassified Campylobacter TaxID=2593542 RepID=UPI001237B1B1|nr:MULTISPECIES: YbgC/FadM family acyl-CoA thioesterase [unclassified Campylobacter]KAA6224784.1 YbgC/FadM family acyl-CoA thioesterase [Campylobacter sp. LR185c]KAA6227359.1 YbgC/FadM family acyl-CoA thioesterase [Campylobacter sp. LR196d]KAA6228736.1 YbgC/FadM family acyl-CoA thioesterase [Campylobacter sp. LR286c]KAA6229546.1 YbgC/FadM family acyl-CoA thioesterase [Campylobacter sp. LR264d]KAA6230790.1 YbgC/FadM family acyl-CoA thioesterase [Campylobacter sp. LR291e]